MTDLYRLRLRARRLALKIGLRQLARVLEVDPALISRVERGLQRTNRWLLKEWRQWLERKERG